MLNRLCCISPMYGCASLSISATVCSNALYEPSMGLHIFHLPDPTVAVLRPCAGDEWGIVLYCALLWGLTRLRRTAGRYGENLVCMRSVAGTYWIMLYVSVFGCLCACAGIKRHRETRVCSYKLLYDPV